MKQVTLKIEDDHYKIMEKLAVLRGESVNDLILWGVKYGMTTLIDEEIDSSINHRCKYVIHPLFGGPKEEEEVQV